MSEQNKPRKQAAYEYIKNKILTCQYKPGLRLNEQQLCQEMGDVSRTPVRDALGRLEQEGLLSILPKKGIVVSELRMNDINRIYEVRTLLEPYALRRYGARLEKKQAEEFARWMADPDQIRPDSFYELDDQFHNFIIQAMPNQYLLETYRNITNRNQRLRVLSGSQVENRIGDTFAEHLVILRAILKQEWEEAALAMLEHLEKARLATFQLIIDNEENF